MILVQIAAILAITTLNYAEEVVVDGTMDCVEAEEAIPNRYHLHRRPHRCLIQWAANLAEFLVACNSRLWAASASQVAHIGAHNAYHLGQIIYVRKLQGSWNPDKGVK